MRQNWLIASIFTLSFVFLVFSGCQEGVKIPNNTKSSDTASAAPNLPPEIKFDDTLLDYNEVGPGTSHIKEWKFENVGPGVLQIVNIQLCCGVYAESDKYAYEPGESGVIKFEYTANGDIGYFVRHPVVYTNDPNNPQIEFTLKSEVVQRVVWEPENIQLFLFKENAGCPKLTIRCLDDQPFAIRGVKSTGNCITADFDPKVKKTEFVLDLKVDMEKLPDNTNGALIINMNHPQGSIAYVYFTVVPKFSFDPSQIILFDQKVNVANKQKIKMINNYPDDFEIESAISEENIIKMISYNKTEDGCELNLEIIPPPDTDGNNRFNDVLKINIVGGDQVALSCIGYYE